MKIANYLCAHLFNSSKAAFRLAMTDTKYLPMAEDIISVKNQNAHKRLMKEGIGAKEYFRLNSKIMKYENFLEKITYVSYGSNARNEEIAFVDKVTGEPVIKKKFHINHQADQGISPQRYRNFSSND
ncbi:hypothetical protein [Erwinia mallotivora]|uniref:hypothetical protein n=1 Tax=Erwinia mallotivora TaxID=69222 RepID=UPI0021BE0F61|nr:hypothetical protein [Erwinia mallotivora]